jgi:hypothetical protein
MPTLSILKNWSNYNDYGQITNSDPNWTVTSEKMALTNKGKIHALLAVGHVIVTDKSLIAKTPLLLNRQIIEPMLHGTAKYLKMHNKKSITVENWWKHN